MRRNKLKFVCGSVGSTPTKVVVVVGVFLLLVVVLFLISFANNKKAPVVEKNVSAPLIAPDPPKNYLDRSVPSGIPIHLTSLLSLPSSMQVYKATYFSDVPALVDQFAQKNGLTKKNDSILRDGARRISWGLQINNMSLYTLNSSVDIEMVFRDPQDSLVLSPETMDSFILSSLGLSSSFVPKLISKQSSTSLYLSTGDEKLAVWEYGYAFTTSDGMPLVYSGYGIEAMTIILDANNKLRSFVLHVPPKDGVIVATTDILSFDAIQNSINEGKALLVNVVDAKSGYGDPTTITGVTIGRGVVSYYLNPETDEMVPALLLKGNTFEKNPQGVDYFLYLSSFR